MALSLGDDVESRTFSSFREESRTSSDDGVNWGFFDGPVDTIEEIDELFHLFQSGNAFNWFIRRANHRRLQVERIDIGDRELADYRKELVRVSWKPNPSIDDESGVSVLAHGYANNPNLKIQKVSFYWASWMDRSHSQLRSFDFELSRRINDPNITGHATLLPDGIAVVRFMPHITDESREHNNDSTQPLISDITRWLSRTFLDVRRALVPVVIYFYKDKDPEILYIELLENNRGVTRWKFTKRGAYDYFGTTK